MKAGRQREFDSNDALDKAMRVFWQKGYFGASIADLTEAMGINKPSMYATFGNKESLFVHATEHYINAYATQACKQLEDDTLSLKEKLRGFLMTNVQSQCDPSSPKGCYVTHSVSESGSEALPTNAQLAIEKARRFAETTLNTFFKSEAAKGHLPDNADPIRLTQFFVALLHGCASYSRADKPFSELEQVIEYALNIPQLEPIRGSK